MGEKIHVPKSLGEFLGHEQDEAYAKAFGTEINDGYDDRGVDLRLGDREVRGVQVKSSIEGVKTFLAESLRREEFIPICVGEPGSKEEMMASLKEFGAWVGADVPGRVEIMKKIAIVRDLCHNKERALKDLLTDLA